MAAEDAGGLSSYENRKNDSVGDRSFITVQSLKKLKEYLAYVRERQVNRGGRHFTTEEIVDTLRSMDSLSIAGEGYVPTYTRTDLTNHLHGSAGRCVPGRSPLPAGSKKVLSTTQTGK